MYVADGLNQLLKPLYRQVGRFHGYQESLTEEVLALTGSVDKPARGSETGEAEISVRQEGGGR